ncbi:hypothetical protein M3Y98_00295600 [Aphelenchoides besseyi]|nr:hypothetical protein M3Y98_00295600 [Aphelenchoides besseyi]
MVEVAQSPDELSPNAKVELNDSIGQKQEPSIITSKKDRYLRYVSLIVLVLQMVSLVLILRYVKTRPGKQFFNTVAVLFSEIVKLVASVILFAVSTASTQKILQEFHYNFVLNFKDTLRVSIPAFIYVIQNFCLFLALSHLDSGTYLVTYQLKILTTGLFTVTILKRRLSVVQWIALVILLLGVIFVQYDPKTANTSTQKSQNITSLEDTSYLYTSSISTKKSSCSANHLNQRPSKWIGVTAVLAAAFMSGFAGIYFEKILKSSNVSLWMRNIQLSLFSIPLAAFMVAVKDYRCVVENGLLNGFDSFVWIAVGIQALGGLIVAMVIKYADNIMKAFATSVSIIVGALFAKILFQENPKQFFFLGTPLVIGAVILYTVPFKWTTMCRKSKSEKLQNTV